MKTATFTTTISPQLLTWVTDYAGKTKQTRRAVLEEALTKYRSDQIRNQMKDDFKRASQDKEILSLTEWGMDDYHKIINS